MAEAMAEAMAEVMAEVMAEARHAELPPSARPDLLPLDTFRRRARYLINY